MSPEALLKEHSDQLMTDLVQRATGKEPIEIRFEEDDDSQWSVFTMHDYKGDNELSLRLHTDDAYDMNIGYYDDDDEFIEIAQPLTEAQAARLPEKLKKIMKKVLADENGLRLPGSLLK